MDNPVLSRSETFTREPYGAPGPGYAPGQPGYGQPMPPGYGQPQPVTDRMTLDDVIAKTGIVLLVLAAVAAVTFMLVPLTMAWPLMLVSMFAGLGTVFFVATRRVIPVAGVLVYAVIEGVFIGLFSKIFELMYPGIVVSAVLATFVTAGVTLAAYKFFNIRVTPKFQKMVLIGTGAFFVTVLVNFFLSLAGVNTGIREIGSGAGWLAIGISLLAVGLAVMSLIVDFDFVERGIANQAPAHESWRAAFGIAITMVWLYTELLRILSYFRD